MNNTRSRPLPNELIDRIIDHLHDDFTTLRCCTLVAKSFLPSSRLHLFITRDFNITSAMYTKLQTDHDAFTSFCLIAPLIQCLVTDWHEMDEGMHMLPVLLSKGLAPRSLAHCGFDTSKLSEDSGLSFPMLGLGESLTSLSLDGVRFSSFSEMIEAITSVPRLETLLLSVHWKDLFVLDFDPSRNLPPRLRTLEIRGGAPVRLLLQWLLTQPSLPALHTLTLSPLYSDDISSVGSLIRLLGPSLERLSLTFIDWNDRVHQAHLSLANMPQLRSFQLTLLRHIHSALPTVIHILSSAHPSARIEMIEFKITLDPCARGSRRSWSQVAEILRKPCFSGLKHITMPGNMRNSEYREMASELEEWMKARVLCVNRIGKVELPVQEEAREGFISRV